MISMDKQYRTRDGREVRIYAVDGGGPYPVHGAYLYDDEWIMYRWVNNGSSYGEPDLNLIEVKPRIQREYWVNVFKDDVGSLQNTKQIADQIGIGRIACVKITIDCQEGEGL